MERLKTMRNEVQRNYLTPKQLRKLFAPLTQQMIVPSHQCCKSHGDENIVAYRLVKNISSHFTYYNNLIHSVNINLPGYLCIAFHLVALS